MKRILLLVLVILGCSITSVERAKKNVTAYVKASLNEPDFYESVYWGSLDSAYYEHFSETPIGKHLFDSCILSIYTDEGIKREQARKFSSMTYDAKCNVFYNDLTFYKKEKRKVIEVYDKTLKPYLDEREIYYSKKPMYRGFQLDHTFRIKGKGKEKLIVKYRFYLDSAYNVTEAKEQDIDAIDDIKETK